MKRRNVLRTSLMLQISLALFACDPSEESANNRELPYYGDHDIGLDLQPDGSRLADTLYFTVPAFSFINQDSIEISHKDYRGHIYVTDFFFTTCPSICPVMSSQMSRLQDKLKNESLFGEVKLLSHTVNPENDTPAVLKAYADKMGADTRYWNFVTGTQDDLYDQARYGYFMTALVSDTAAGGFFHSDIFVLVDTQGHLRGVYDGTSTKEVDQLFEDIILLNTQENGTSSASAE
ncbi:MAG: SCO family protein [Flavobacteriales bacterium]|nr:SCO family protein [Flavobacteriales bacterium]